VLLTNLEQNWKDTEGKKIYIDKFKPATPLPDFTNLSEWQSVGRRPVDKLFSYDRQNKLTCSWQAWTDATHMDEHFKNLKSKGAIKLKVVNNP
jgi:hypothetical protein